MESPWIYTALYKYKLGTKAWERNLQDQDMVQVPEEEGEGVLGGRKR